MLNIDCYSARGLNMVLGIFLLAVGVFFLVSGVTIFPVIGFFFAIPVIGVSLYFLFAPPDKACFMPWKKGYNHRKKAGTPSNPGISSKGVSEM